MSAHRRRILFKAFITLFEWEEWVVPPTVNGNGNGNGHIIVR